MNSDFRFSSQVFLIIGLSVIGIVSAIGFMNNSYAADTSMNSSMSMNTNMTMNASKTMNENMSMTGNISPNNETVISSPPPPEKTLSPVEQVKSGIAPSSVKCGQGYDLILNLFDSRPACIKSEDMTSFVSRGWGHAV